MAFLSAPPLQDSVIELDGSPDRKKPFFMAKPWILWFTDDLAARAQQSISQLATATVPNATDNGSADIPTRSAYLVTQAGRYRVTYTLRITQAATVSSDATVTLSWVRQGVTVIWTGATDTDNVTNKVQTETVLAQADAQTDITYAVVRHSTGATPMHFELDLLIERVS
jgi:hypothetical protein